MQTVSWRYFHLIVTGCKHEWLSRWSCHRPAEDTLATKSATLFSDQLGAHTLRILLGDVTVLRHLVDGLRDLGCVIFIAAIGGIEARPIEFHIVAEFAAGAGAGSGREISGGRNIDVGAAHAA